LLVLLVFAGVIVYGSDQEVVSLMKAVRRNNATGNFSWIGSDGWSARDMVSDHNEAEVEGCVSVQPQANPVDGFEEYFLRLNVENNRRNPWFTGTYDGIIPRRFLGVAKITDRRSFHGYKSTTVMSADTKI